MDYVAQFSHSFLQQLHKQFSGAELSEDKSSDLERLNCPQEQYEHKRVHLYSWVWLDKYLGSMIVFSIYCLIDSSLSL